VAPRQAAVPPDDRITIPTNARLAAASSNSAKSVGWCSPTKYPRLVSPVIDLLWFARSSSHASLVSDISYEADRHHNCHGSSLSGDRPDQQRLHKRSKVGMCEQCNRDQW